MVGKIKWKIIDKIITKEKTKPEVELIYTGECVPEKVKLSASCGCLNPKWHPTERKITTTIRIGEFPKHFSKERNEWDISKTIKMQYLCNGVETEDFIKIKVTVLRDVVI